VNINDGKMNNSMPLNPEYFPERFELNDNCILKKRIKKFSDLNA